MRILCDIRYEPATKQRQIRLGSWFSCFNLRIGNPIYFMIDTGAVRSLISERDAKIVGIDFSKLELQKEPAVGLGGTAPLYRIKSESKLTFHTAEKKEHVESFPGFDVAKVAIDDQKTHDLVFNLIPSLLGMDFLERFKFFFNKDVAYLER